MPEKEKVKTAIVKIEYSQDYLDKFGTTLEQEINGWLDYSDMKATVIKEEE